MNSGSYREFARLHARCMGLDKVEPWIIFTWKKPWINYNWLALCHALVLATRLDLQIAVEMDNGAALWWWLASLTSWNGSHHRTQTNSLSQLTDPFTRCRTCCAVCWTGWRILYVRSWQDHTRTLYMLDVDKRKVIKSWTVAKIIFPIDSRTHTHTSMLSVRPILISVISDNGFVNEVRRAWDQWLMQLMVISGWSHQWCSNKVNISWDMLLRRGWASLCPRTLSLQSVPFYVWFWWCVFLCDVIILYDNDLMNTWCMRYVCLHVNL